MEEIHPAIGLDVGGTGIKGAAIDPDTGEKLTSRHKVLTPQGGAPADIAREVGAMARAIRAELVDFGLAAADARLPVGVTLPGVVRGGVMRTAANIDKSWIGTDAVALLSEAVGSPCLVVNDADAAGLAEVSFGEAAGLDGSTLVLVFGTGIGSSLIYDGTLVPNLELGHIQFDGYPIIERHTAAKVIEREGITLAEWAARVERYLQHLETTINPDRFVLGGSISKISDEYLPFAGVSVPVIPARLRNNAGIVGAARLAALEPRTSGDLSATASEV